MAYSPYKPEPPAPVESVSAFGMDNFVWRATWFVSYVGLVLLTMPSCRGCSLGQLIFLHAMWFVAACFAAREANKLVCEMTNEESQRTHAKQLVAAMMSQPIRALERNPATGTLDPVFSPLRERPLLDPEMGVRVRS